MTEYELRELGCLDKELTGIRATIKLFDTMINAYKTSGKPYAVSYLTFNTDVLISEAFSLKGETIHRPSIDLLYQIKSALHEREGEIKEELSKWSKLELPE